VDGRGSADVIAGIAAFPSLHVAVPALFVCAFPRWRFVWIPFTAVTLIGSILLGWHYLIDGYAGVALAWASWRVAR
jgi:membrane-associated phospholipid phosphatase